MNALLFFCILFCIFYSIVRSVRKSEETNRSRNLQEVEIGGRQPRPGVVKSSEDEAGGLLLLARDLRDNND